MPLQPRPELKSLVPTLHGGPDTAELKSFGLSPDDIIDFSVCSNPFAPPPEVMKAADKIEINRYPDSESTELRECLADSLGVPAENILAGSGAIVYTIPPLAARGCGRPENFGSGRKDP